MFNPFAWAATIFEGPETSRLPAALHRRRGNVVFQTAFDRFAALHPGDNRNMNTGVKSLLALLVVGGVGFAQGNLPDLAHLKLAAEAGNAEAQFEYGDKIKLSNAKESFDFQLKSAQQGFGPAEEAVGAHYLTVALTSFKDRSAFERLGVRYSSRAAIKGLANAAVSISQCYEHGIALPKNPLLAYAWLASAVKSAGGPQASGAYTYKSYLDQLMARTPANVIAQGQRVADSFQPGGEGLNPVEADLLVAQMKITGLYFVGQRKTVVVNETRFDEGETKTLPIDGEPVSLRCTAIEGKIAKFKLDRFDLTLTSK